VAETALLNSMKMNNKYIWHCKFWGFHGSKDSSLLGCYTV